MGYSAFNDAHAMMLLCGLHRLTDAEALMARAARAAESARTSNAAMAREVSLPLMAGLLAFGDGRFSDAVRWLAPLRERAHHFGGSHAQRDVIDQSLIAAAAGAKDRSLSRALLNERRLAKAVTPLTEHWTRTSGLSHHR